MKSINMTHRRHVWLFTAIGILAFQITFAAEPSTLQKPRVIATTDGEIDDHSSMIRFLLYTCDFDVAGIVEVNSSFQKSGHSNEPWLEDQLAAYEQVLPYLRMHNPDYPSAEYLRSVCRVGNESANNFDYG